MNAAILAAWAADPACDPLPEAIAKAKDHVLDLSAIIWAAANAGGACAAWPAKVYAWEMGAPRPGVIAWEKGAPRRRTAVRTLTPAADSLSAESAAFFHAAAGHSLELDDVHNGSSLHPGVAVIPAALAAACERGASGLDFLKALVIGYEAAIRIGEAAGPSALYGRGFHPTAVCGVFSSAIVAGRLMGLTPEQLTHALGLAWSFAGGNMSFQTEGSMAKALQVGNAARCGVMAARLAELGATGPAGSLEAEGFFKAYGGQLDPDKLLDGLGERRLKILECGLKPFACCRYIHAPLDTLLEIRAAEGWGAGDAESVERIDISMATTGQPLVAHPREVKLHPPTTAAAQFSLYHSAAVAFITGSAGPAQYGERWLRDGAVRRLADRIKVHTDPEIDELYPAQWAARVRVTFKDGRSAERFNSYSLGDPEKPLAGEALAIKVRSLLEMGMMPEAPVFAAFDRLGGASRMDVWLSEMFAHLESISERAGGDAPPAQPPTA